MKRLLAVDDHEVVLEGIRNLFEREGFEVTTAPTATAAVGLAAEQVFDVAVVDLGLPDLPGEEAIRQLTELPVPPAVVAHAMGDEKEALRNAIRAGARGVASKAASREDLVSAVRAVAAGDAFVSPALAHVVLELARGRNQGRVGGLAEMDRSVLRGIARGDRTERIAGRLGVSSRTVEAARARLKTQLGARGTADLVRLALAEGLLDE